MEPGIIEEKGGVMHYVFYGYKRLFFLIVAFCFCFPFMEAGAAETGSVSAGRLNVLFIVVDDLRTDLGCYGSGVVKSPNIDRLAESGVRFDNACVQGVFCNPSRTSFLTGLFPQHTGIFENRTYYRKKLPDVTTLPQLFRKNGYCTAGFGKIFHGHDAEDSAATWDVTVAVRQTPLGRKGRGRNLTGGKVKWCSWRAAEGGDEDQPDGQMARHAIRFLKNRPKNKPFFLAVGFHKPHDPFVAPKAYFDLYPLEKMQLPEVPADRSPSAIQLQGWKRAFDAFTDTDRKEFMRSYYACTTFMDAQVGKVLSELDRLELRDKTVIFFLSDHGYHLGEHDWWNKNTLYEFSCRSPLIVSAPGMKGMGTACGSLVEFVDIYPTLAGLCGLSVPRHCDGRSFASLLDAPALPHKKAVFSQYGNGCTVRTDAWRYARCKRGPVEEAIFDRARDPAEYYNVIDVPGHQAVVKKMRLLLEKRFPRGAGTWIPKQ